MSSFEPIWLYLRTRYCIVTKFQGHRPFGSREEDFKVFTIYRYGGHFGHGPFEQTFVLLSLGESDEILLLSAQRFLKEKKFENVESE